MGKRIKKEDFLKLPFLPLEDMPVGSQLIPASFFFENYDGDAFIYLPPKEVLQTEEDFKKFKDKLINTLIDKGLSNESKRTQNQKIDDKVE